MTEKISQEKLTYSVDEAAVLLGIGRSLAYQLVNEGKLPVLKLGKRKLIPRHALMQILYCNDIKGENIE